MARDEIKRAEKALRKAKREKDGQEILKWETRLRKHESEMHELIGPMVL